MSPIDWSIILATVAFLTFVAVRTRRHTRSVADFLSANRCAGRYLLGTAEGAAGLGAISIIAIFEKAYATGFAPNYWNALSIPIGLFITLSGWVIYRFRETRAMTMAQFFEARYSRRFRIFAGILAWVAGIINFGIFPGVGARFFVSFCGLPEYNMMVGPFEISLTFAFVMFLLLAIAVLFTFSGGQIAVLVTDFWQGVLTLFFISLIVIFIWLTVPWETMTESLRIGSEPGKSLFDPYDIGRSDFDFGFFLIGYFFALYHFMAWQGNQGYRSSAISPHEAKMANVVGGLRSGFITLGMILMPILAIVVMHHPDYVATSTRVSEALQTMYPDNEQLRTQMRVPVVLSEFLPIGLLGGFAASMLGFFISTHNTYMHSWGSIFIQDVILPLRGDRAFGPERHLKFLRWSVVGVAIFIYFFSLLFPLRDYIYMFFAITGAIYLGGAGAVIIGGLYWKKGTTAGAWSAMILGSGLALASITAQQTWDMDFMEPVRRQVTGHQVGQPVALQGKLSVAELPGGGYDMILRAKKAKGGTEAGQTLETEKFDGIPSSLGTLDRLLDSPLSLNTRVIRRLAPEWYLLGDAGGQFVARIDTPTELERETYLSVSGRIRFPKTEAGFQRLDPEGTWSNIDNGRYVEVETFERFNPEAKGREVEDLGKHPMLAPVKLVANLDEHLGGQFYQASSGGHEAVVRINPSFPYNGQYLAFFSALIAIGAYIVVSLFFPGKDANLERILHRGKYRIPEDEAAEKAHQPKETRVAWYWRMIGVNGHEFTRVDKLLFLFTFGYGMYGVLGFIVLAIIQANGAMQDSTWFFWWRLSLFVQLGLAILGGLWVSVGGIFDLRRMYRRLSTIERNELDDGRVSGDQSLADREVLKHGDDHHRAEDKP